MKQELEKIDDVLELAVEEIPAEQPPFEMHLTEMGVLCQVQNNSDRRLVIYPPGHLREYPLLPSEAFPNFIEHGE